MDHKALHEKASYLTRPEINAAYVELMVQNQELAEALAETKKGQANAQ